MSGKGAKGLITGKSSANKDKDKKAPTSRSSRAGLQVIFLVNFDGFFVHSFILFALLFLKSNW